MPTLNWIGKDKVVGHHNDVSYHVLEHQYGYSAEKGQTTEPTHSGNMIIHGEVFLMGVNRLTIGGPLLRFVLLFIDCKGSNFWWNRISFLKIFALQYYFFLFL